MTVMGASSQSHSGQSRLPYQRSRNPQAGSPAKTAYSLRRSDAGASDSSTTRPMLVQGERGGSAARALAPSRMQSCLAAPRRSFSPAVRTACRNRRRRVAGADRMRGSVRAGISRGEPGGRAALNAGASPVVLHIDPAVRVLGGHDAPIRSCRHSSSDIPSAMRSGPAGGRLLLRGLSCAARRGCGPAAGRAVAARRGCDRAIAPSDRSRRGGADRPPRFASSRRPRG